MINITREEIRNNLNKDYPNGIPLSIKLAINDAVELGRKEGYKELFDKFDKFACIKNDKWYLDFKKDYVQLVNERKELRKALKPFT